MVRNTFVSVFWMGWPFGVPHHNPKEPRPNPRKFREKNVGRNTHCLVNENERTSYLTRGHNPTDEKPEKKNTSAIVAVFGYFFLGWVGLGLRSSLVSYFEVLLVVYLVPILRPPRDKPINGVLSLLWSCPSFKTIMALVRDKTENGLKSEENVMHAIASTYILLIRCECPLAAVPTPPKGTQQKVKNYP